MSAGAAPSRPLTALLEVDELSVDFRVRGEWVRAVDSASFRIAPGETVGLVGESGSGKSVTSLALMGLLPPHTSRVSAKGLHFEGRDLLNLSRREIEDLRGNEVAMIFQDPMSSLNPAFTVGDQIAETIRRHRRCSRRDARAAAVQALDEVGIPNAARRVGSYPHEFSGGMRQRVMIAIALSCDPKLLIADEPTTALDVTIQAQILDLIRDLREEHHTSILFITHDLGVVADLCDRVIVMYAGEIVEEAPVFDLFGAPNHPYSSALLRSMPVITGDGADLNVIPGALPPPGGRPAGCRFGPRCEHHAESCDTPIDLTETGDGRSVRCVRADQLDLALAGGRR